ncbi:MAG: hypothetical protein ACOCQR_03070 [bacterium]
MEQRFKNFYLPFWVFIVFSFGILALVLSSTAYYSDPAAANYIIQEEENVDAMLNEYETYEDLIQDVKKEKDELSNKLATESISEEGYLLQKTELDKHINSLKARQEKLFLDIRRYYDEIISTRKRLR